MSADGADTPQARRIGPDEAASVHALLAACGRRLAAQGFRNWDPPYALDRIREDACVREVYLVRRAGAPVATFTLAVLAGPVRALRLYRLAVDPDAQGHGLGRWCMAWVEARAAALGCTVVCFDVLAENVRLRAFYEGLGYAARGHCARDGWEFATYERALAAAPAATSEENAG